MHRFIKDVTLEKSKEEKFYEAVLGSYRLGVGMGGETDALGLQSVPDESPQLGRWKEVVLSRLSSIHSSSKSTATPLARALNRLLLLRRVRVLPETVRQAVLSSRGGGRHWGEGLLVQPWQA